MRFDERTECPECKCNWNDGDIYEVLRSKPSYNDKTDEEVKKIANDYYGWSEESPKHFSRLIGIEILGEYDGISYWKCPECNNLWNRFTGKLVDKEIIKYL